MNNTVKVSEAISVQFPMVTHAEEIGWQPVSPQAAEQKRGGTHGMLFRDELEAKLKEFNPWMKASTIQQAIENLEANSPTIEYNREVLAWLKGERQLYDEEEKRHRRVQFIDFETPDANIFHVTWEWRIKPPARKSNRADVMFVINGVPVAIVENKNPKDRDAIERATVQLRRYEVETPELFSTSQLFNVTHLIDYWYGVTWNASRRYMARWKTREESYRFAVQSFFERSEFLRTLKDWIFFYVEDGETRKAVLRQHQRRAIDRIVARCQEPEKHRGLVWHTQGSGKTFTLLTAAKLILKRKEEFRNATVILIVDRIELEGQLSGWVEKLLGELQQQDIPVWRATSKEEVQGYLETDKRGLILSMIHKFHGIQARINTRDNIYVFIDEAHRSVNRELGTYLMAAVPNATLIGFTGTPIARTSYGESTFVTFGQDDDRRYLDKYSIEESIEDETTLPIRHTMAPSDMTVPTERLDKEFFELAEGEGITDVQELNKVLKRAVGLCTFLTADDRIRKVAAFVAQHFKENVEPLGYKAFLVGVNREACAKYKQALDKLLPPEWISPIYTEDTADIVERKLVAEFQPSQRDEESARTMFKRADTAPRILVVTDKLLTGYDAPILYCMYLDKPMRDHVLLQAIARVNRPYVDTDGICKPSGLIVDFIGVLQELNKALRFDSADVHGVIENLDLLKEDFFAKISKARTEYLEDDEKRQMDQRLESIIYGRFLDLEEREKFFKTYKEIEVLWEILSPSSELRDYIETFKQLAQLYATVRNAYTDEVDFVDDIAHKTRRLVQESATQEKLGQFTKSVTFDMASLEALRNKPGSNEAKVFNLVRGLREEAKDSESFAPVLLPLKERAESILKDIENHKKTGLQAMDLLEALAKEKEKIVKAEKESGLSARAFNIYWKLKDDSSLGVAGISARDLAEEAERLLIRFPDAAVNNDEKVRLRTALYRPLLQLDQDESVRIVKTIFPILLGDNDDAD